MRKSIFSFLLCFSVLWTANARESTASGIGNDPTANPEATVTFGKARFTVLTPRLVRMEWSEDGKFEDRATLGIVNRRLEVPEYDVRKNRNSITLKTGFLTLKYHGQDKFDAENLSISFLMSADGKEKGEWHPGKDANGNLLGTTRTLDRCDGNGVIEPYDPGIISRDGWAVIDESERHVFEPVESDWKHWVGCRDSVDRQDLYIFCYGHDYTDALNDFTKIAGKIPLPPKYAFGYWWCRYWQYSDFELIDLAEHFKDFNIPIDVMIIDMDWHETWSELKAATPAREPGGRPGLDDFGESIGWTGYTWKKEFFPDPANFLEQLHRMGIKNSLNLHFNNGIQPYEEPYDRFVKDYLSRTDDYDGPKDYMKADGSKAPVPFRIDQEEWTEAYFNSVIHPLERSGVDFWWLDWQQWRDSRYTPGLSNTFWLNYAFFQDKVRQTESMGIYAPRPMIYHRWGGIGSHRYQVGFSGDTFANWKVLGYLPYFTATASNVCYGYWGHDIGGHQQPGGVHSTDPELYTRWMQSGVFTPIYKTHSTKDSSMEKRFWVFPDHFDAMREAVRLRYDLSPYIYTAARQAYDTGISICRPLYYSLPENENAYTWDEEFMFGDDILATVVCEPVDSITGLAGRRVWFPEGCDWYDVSTGTMYKGGTEHDLLYTINENPYYVKAGAVIPMAGPQITSLQKPDKELRLLVVPGAGESRTKVYEDDGTTQAYDTEYAFTGIVRRMSGDTLTVDVLPREGSYKDMPETRKVTVMLDGFAVPEKVTVNGVEIPYSRFASFEAEDGKAVWGYDGSSLTATIYTPEASAGGKVTVECVFNDVDGNLFCSGKKGLVKRMMALTPETKLMVERHVMHGMQLPVEFLNIAQCGSYITENPENAAALLQGIDIPAMNSRFAAFSKLPEWFREKLSAQTALEEPMTDRQ